MNKRLLGVLLCAIILMFGCTSSETSNKAQKLSKSDVEKEIVLKPNFQKNSGNKYEIEVTRAKSKGAFTDTSIKNKYIVDLRVKDIYKTSYLIELKVLEINFDESVKHKAVSKAFEDVFLKTPITFSVTQEGEFKRITNISQIKKAMNEHIEKKAKGKNIDISKNKVVKQLQETVKNEYRLATAITDLYQPIFAYYGVEFSRYGETFYSIAANEFWNKDELAVTYVCNLNDETEKHYDLTINTEVTEEVLEKSVINTYRIENEEKIYERTSMTEFVEQVDLTFNTNSSFFETLDYKMESIYGDIAHKKYIKWSKID